MLKSQVDLENSLLHIPESKTPREPATSCVTVLGPIPVKSRSSRISPSIYGCFACVEAAFRDCCGSLRIGAF